MHTPVPPPRRTARSRALLAATALLLLLTALPAAAVTRSGESHNGNAQNSRRADGAGPTSLAVEWVAEGTGYEVSGSQGGTSGNQYGQLVSDGRLIATANRIADGVPMLLAFDVADGTLLWDTEGVAGGCKPVVDDQGDIWAFITDAGGFPAVAAIDPATGVADPVRQVNSPDGVGGLAPCTYGLHVASNGLVVVDQGDLLIAIDPATAAVAWTTPLVAGSGLVMTDPVSGDLIAFHTPVADVHMLDIDPATGAVERTYEQLGGEFITPQATFISDAGLAVVSVNPPLLSGQPTRTVAVGLQALTQQWERTGEPDDLDGAFDGLGLGGAAGELAVGGIGGGDVIALDLSDGSTAWTAALPGAPATRLHQTDSAGRTYVELFAPTEADAAIAVIGPDGTVLDTLEQAVAGPVLSVDAIADGLVLGTTGSGGDQAWIAFSQDGDEAVQPGEPGVGRIDGEDTIGSICQVQQPDPDSAASVLLARRDNFADALAGSALAGTDSCILFTTGGPDATLDPGTRAELDRVLADGGLVRILGGTAAISAAVEAELAAAGYDVERFAGASRYETALLIARQVRAENPGNTDAMLAFAGNWPDAVTGGAYAAATGTPILLTDPGATHPTALQGAQELGVTRTFVLGGSAVISDAAAEGMPGAVRVAGDNRMATAVATATQLWGPLLGGQAPDSFTVVNLERDDSYSLALAAAPLSAKLGGPQLGVGQGRFPDETRTYLEGVGFTELPAAVLVGDVGIIDDGTASAIEGTIEP